MYTTHKSLLATSLFCLGMMSSAITLANVQAQNPQPFVEEEQNIEEAQPGVDESGLADLQKMLARPDYATSTQSNNQQNTYAGNGEDGGVSYDYPKFSQEERVNPVGSLYYEEAALNNASLDNKDDQTEENELEYLESVAILYQHLPPNPVYTYGKDNGGEGSCIGSDDFCSKSEAIWDNFETYEEQDELLIQLEGEDKGQLVMPGDYKASVDNQPKASKGAPSGDENGDNDISGYNYHPSGNQYKSGAHHGRLEGNTYYVYNSDK